MVVPEPRVTPDERERILLRALRHADRACRRDILTALRHLREATGDYSQTAAARYRAMAAAYYEDGTISERRYVKGLCAR